MNKDTQLNERPQDLKPGDYVTADFYEKDKEVVRRITHICKDNRFGSGYGAGADRGTKCTCCGKYPAEYEVTNVDACWFIPYENLA